MATTSATARAQRVRAWMTASAIGLLAAMLATGIPAASASYPGGDGKIAFVRSNQIYTINPDGTGARQLTTGAKNYLPKWSPSGTRIAYVHETSTGSKDIWVMSATGSNKNQVTHLGKVTEPTWSPDGKWLAFGGGADPVLMKIKSTSPFGSPQTLLGYRTNYCSMSPYDQDPTELSTISVDRFVAWSPTANRIAVFNHEDCAMNDTVYMYYPSTKEDRLYDATGASCCGYYRKSWLTWGPDGDFGYVVEEYDEDTDSFAPPRVVYPSAYSASGFTSFSVAPATARYAVTVTGTTPRIYIQKFSGGSVPPARVLLTNGYQPDWQAVP